MKATAYMRNIIYMSKNPEKSAQFFVDVIGLKIIQMSPTYSELIDTSNFKIIFQQTDSEAHTRIGFNPLITFNIPNFSTVLERLENYPEVEYDGEVRKDDLGQVTLIYKLVRMLKDP